MDTVNFFKSIGFDERQARAYTALLSLGETQMTELAKHARLKRPSTYLVIEKLQLLGLVSETLKGKRKVYSAVHPHRLLQLAEFRATRMREVLPELLALYNAPKEKPKIQVFEGSEGIRALYHDLYQSLSTNQNEEALWFTRIDALQEHVPEALSEYKRLLRKLKNPRIRELNYGNKEGKHWPKELRPLKGKNHFIRTLPPDFEFGATDNLIFENKLVIFSLHREAPFVVTIENSEVVKTSGLFTATILSRRLARFRDSAHSHTALVSRF